MLAILPDQLNSTFGSMVDSKTVEMICEENIPVKSCNTLIAMLQMYVPQHPRILPETHSCSTSRYLASLFYPARHYHLPFHTRQEVKMFCQVVLIGIHCIPLESGITPALFVACFHVSIPASHTRRSYRGSL